MFSRSPTQDKVAALQRNRRLAYLSLFVVVALVFIRFSLGHESRLGQVPRFVLWAWERPEDLRFINPDDTAVAFLSKSIRIHGDEVLVRPRFQQLLVPDQAKLLAVARVEVGPDAALSRTQAERAAAVIADAASLPRVVGVQVDFDATVSQRPFYRDLLIELRRRLKPQTPISITALASWCLDDNWISGLPIDEAVPMLFRMGPGTDEVVTRLNSGRDFNSAVCRSSLGISTDERWTSLPSGRRLYVFHPQPWTENTELAMRWEVRQWH